MEWVNFYLLNQSFLYRWKKFLFHMHCLCYRFVFSEGLQYFWFTFKDNFVKFMEFCSPVT